jgi:ABC-type transport system involved in multi-copper enzyme maturation permease subunit
VNGSRVWTITTLELTQRVRTSSWYILLGVCAVILLGVTTLAFSAWWGEARGVGVYSTVVFVVLLLAVFVSPTLSGNAINGDRDAATLAPVQVTLATTFEILFGKFLAAWITGLAFVAVSLPFLLVATLAGGATPAVVVISLVVLIVEIGVIAAVGVGLSGILARPIFSVAVTYLVVAALVVGTPIAFGLAGASVRSEATTQYRSFVYDETTGEADTSQCGPWETSTYEVPRFDYVWWMLAPNPFVILADATPATFSADGFPTDLFGQLKIGVRQAQLPPDLEQVWDDCNPVNESGSTPEEILASTVPSWFVGLGLQILLATGLMWWAWARTRTPSRMLPPGTRIA